jgi:polyhydroxybutyrate depolymerase
MSARLSIAVGDRIRTLTVVGPEDAPPGRALVVAFHGSRQTGDVHRAFTGRTLDELAAEGTAVVAYPDGYRGNWNDARRESAFPARRAGIDDVAFFRALVDRLAATHGIDRGRVIVTGFSNGGQFVMRLLHEVPDLVAGAVILGATLPVAESLLLPEPLPPARPTPVAVVHGTRDPIIPFGGGAMPWWARTLFRVGGRSLSSAQTAAYFAARNGIAAHPAPETLPARTGDTATRVERVVYREGGKPPVLHAVVHGGGHTVPGPTPAPAVVGRTSPDLSLADLVREVLAGQETGASRSSSS